MAGRMQGDTCRAERTGRTIVETRDGVAGSEAMPRERLAGPRDDVVGAAVAQMITMGMSDDRRLHRLPRINEEISERAVQPAGCCRHQGFGIAEHFLDRERVAGKREDQRIIRLQVLICKRSGPKRRVFDQPLC